MVYHFGLLGYPLEHSFSPRLHQAALVSVGLSGTYDLFDLPSRGGGKDEMQDLVGRLRQGSLHGLNVTIPYKMAVISYLDALSPMARAIGAVNTVVVQAGKLVGENYDSLAFREDMTDHLGQVGVEAWSQMPDHSALVLGAGGSARAVVYALLQAGWRVMIASRRLEQSMQLVSAFQTDHRLNACLIDELASLDLAGIGLLVNATPLGMVPDVKSSAWPVNVALPPAACVYDLVYNPPETALLNRARHAGLLAVNGLGMLVRQAALSFAAWTGKEPDLQVMYRSLESHKVSL